MLTAVRERYFSLPTAGVFFYPVLGRWLHLDHPHFPLYLLLTITFFILADDKSGQGIKLLSLFFFSTYIMQHTLYHKPPPPPIAPMGNLSISRSRVTRTPTHNAARLSSTSDYRELLFGDKSRGRHTAVKLSAAIQSLLLSREVLPSENGHTLCRQRRFKEILTRSQRATWNLFCRWHWYY